MNYPGKLIIVEGTDGSGKSTQIALLKTWLEHQGYPVVFTEWNSSALVKSWTKKAKQQKQLSPATFHLIHGADFYERYERFILPLLRAGFIVLADRYIYTAFARDAARGCNRAWVHNTYRDVVRPALSLYFQTPLNVAVDRILVGRTELKYHEAGLDLGISDDPVESFKIFQGLVKQEYDRMADEEHLHVIDATLPIDVQQREVRRLTESVLKNYEGLSALQLNTGKSAHFCNEAINLQQAFAFQNHKLPGKLIVIEGSDYSHHYQYSQKLKEFLEIQGYAVYSAGIKRSKLMRQAIDEAKEEQMVGPRTMALFYATDFFSELEHGILPALRAGMVVVADRYIFTLMARQLVRGEDSEWLHQLYQAAPKPDLALYLDSDATTLACRCLQQYGQLFYWEAGMDLAISPDALDSLLHYQNGLLAHYRKMANLYGMQMLPAFEKNTEEKIQKLALKLLAGDEA
ncbi:dTMP kinase [Alicyclobacillus tolerans]|uniref:Thymidylate kinase n=2 Tax=Alicyclobacillus tolerans TaxID=90970 RepID=A0ABT9LXV3_9BACL|nr:MULTISPECIES: hypothetical protein [Alicyclobacillus]MDP9729091.1 dTMP kinase [Alicyclobacillus tengchongensis]SHK87188.1 dTMP kinase [Alicyclobacillus montanus]